MQGKRSSQALVCQLSSATSGGIQGERDTWISPATALTNGSYVARSSASFYTLAVAFFQEKPAAASCSRTWIHSEAPNLFTPAIGGVWRI